MTHDDINYFAEAISKINFPQGITWKYENDNPPTNETEWLKYYYEFTDEGEDPWTNNPDDFHVTWQQILDTIEIVKVEIPLNNLRFERDLRISETDWWVLPDRNPTDEQLAYRQALRDITNNYTSLDNVVWPEKPE